VVALHGRIGFGEESNALREKLRPDGRRKEEKCTEYGQHRVYPQLRAGSIGRRAFERKNPGRITAPVPSRPQVAPPATRVQKNLSPSF
jgi:hypothetical protein